MMHINITAGEAIPHLEPDFVVDDSTPGEAPRVSMRLINRGTELVADASMALRVAAPKGSTLIRKANRRSGWVRGAMDGYRKTFYEPLCFLVDFPELFDGDSVKAVEYLVRYEEELARIYAPWVAWARMGEEGFDPEELASQGVSNPLLYRPDDGSLSVLRELRAI